MAGTRIVGDPGVMPGKPVIEGTRITVKFVLEELAHGQSIEAPVASHPTLTIEGVRAALDYAAQVLKSDIAARSALPMTRCSRWRLDPDHERQGLW